MSDGPEISTILPGGTKTIFMKAQRQITRLPSSPELATTVRLEKMIIGAEIDDVQHDDIVLLISSHQKVSFSYIGTQND
jgi:hypothetical protein